jgi:mannose-1-phosphate guanylyltransferase
MQALILAGGEGTRLRPLTTTVPKPVIPLANRPFISFMLDWLMAHGVNDIVMSCGFLAEGVRSVLGDGAELGIRIRYVEEEHPLDTAGAVKFAELLLDERFLVMNGDILADFNLSALQRLHEARNAKCTIALTPVEDPSAYGLVRTGPDSQVEAFLEKASPQEIDTNLINAGAYVLERDVLAMIPDGKPFSFERDVFPALTGNGLYGFEATGYWLDIGTPERYLEATRDILEGNVETVIKASLSNGAALSIGVEASVDPAAEINGPSLAGAGSEIDAGARLGPLAVIGDRCRVGQGAIVERAVLHQSVEVERGAVVRESIVGAGARIGASSRVEAGTIIGAGAVIGSDSVLEGERIEARAEVGLSADGSDP